MFSDQLKKETISINGVLLQKKVLLADVNIPYKFSIDKNRNSLFFCINADDFSDQSFHSVMLPMDSDKPCIVGGIRNGFASAVDQSCGGTVYLGGSDGIFRYNYDTGQVDKPPYIPNVDIFDMYYQDYLFYVDTANQNLYLQEKDKARIIPQIEDFLVQHFSVDTDGNIFFINSDAGVYSLSIGAEAPVLYAETNTNFRGATVDCTNVPHFIAEDGIYAVDKVNTMLHKILTLENGYGLAFDVDNNIIYSNERSVYKLLPL